MLNYHVSIQLLTVECTRTTRIQCVVFVENNLLKMNNYMQLIASIYSIKDASGDIGDMVGPDAQIVGVTFLNRKINGFSEYEIMKFFSIYIKMNLYLRVPAWYYQL